jgi:membrane peptidoglycan carboxypeptidase
MCYGTPLGKIIGVLALDSTSQRPSRGGKHASRTRKPPQRQGAKKPAQATPGKAWSAGQPNGKRARPRKRGFFRRYWWAFVATPLVLILALVATLMYAYAHIQLPNTPPPARTTFIYDRFGNKIGELHGAFNRTEIPLSQMPKVLQDAVIDTEDKSYYHHGGISVSGIVRAAWQDLLHHSAVQGGSTITQQYVKNVYTNGERSIFRKVKEALYAIKLEHKFSKDEILEKYLNTIYFGHGAYGVEAASQTYFHHSARKDDALEAATLAGMIASPGRFDPVEHAAAAKARRNYVLQQMVQQGHLGASEAARLEAKPVAVFRDPNRTRQNFAYFMDYTRQWLLHKYGDELTYAGGLRVTTSLDRRVQHAAETAVADHLPAKSDPSAALVAIDPRTGQIRAMVGGPDFDQLTNNENLAVAPSRRQAGSAFKPFTLAAAMKQKFSLNSYWEGPSQITIPDRRCYTTDPDTGKYGPWTLSNAADEESGTFSLVNATAFSVNTVFAQLVTALDKGPKDVVDTAHAMGIESTLRPVCSITLGTQEVSPLEMTRAYATLADRGVRHSATPISQVKSVGHSIETKPNTKGTRVLDANDADLVTYSLQRVVAYGTGTAADLSDREVAGKTGTTNSEANAWFCGYIPQLAACVWMGYHTGNKPMHDIEGVSDVFGGTIPAAIWHDFMTQVTQELDLPAVDFHSPSFVGYNRQGPTATPAPPPRSHIHIS